MVFDDFQQLNILYSAEDNRVFLVGFDGASKYEENRYYPCPNPELGLGVSKWQIMEKPYDRANLERVISSSTVKIKFCSLTTIYIAKTMGIHKHR